MDSPLVRRCRVVCLLVALVAVCSARPARAQIVEMAEGLTLAATVSTLVSPAGSRAVGDAFQNALLLEVATTPLGNASSGFTFTFDSELGLDDRTSATFGPSFSERARTSGAGAFSIGANLLTASYDKIGDVSLDEFELSSVLSSNPRLSRTTSASLVLSSTTLVMFGTMGVTDDFDVGVAVPFVDVGIQGISWVESQHENPDQRLLVNSEGGASESGLGDVELSGKYRLHQFGDKEDPPESGGIALAVRARVPTGSKTGLRGLGITRTAASVIFSRSMGAISPHANVGYEWWSDSLDIVDSSARDVFAVKGQLMYAAGVGVEVNEGFSLNVDFLGRHFGNAGRIGARSVIPDFSNPAETTVESITFLGPLSEGIRKLTLVPGLKWNLKGSVLLSLNALIALDDNGLHDTFLPVVGLDWTF